MYKHLVSMKVVNGIRRGFTLIELLVMVLIISMLAAIALPQYQKAVIKSRYNTLKHLTQSIYEAEQIHYLATGAYTLNFEELDIRVGNLKQDAEDNLHHRYFSWGFCDIVLRDTPDEAFAYCRNTQIGMAYAKYFSSGKAYCLTYTNAPLIHEICKQETNNDPGYAYP